MIQYTQGNLLEADVEALVNTVNTVGVMGKGVHETENSKHHDAVVVYVCRHAS